VHLRDIGGVEELLHSYSNLALDGVSGHIHSLAALFPGKEYPVQLKRKLDSLWSQCRDLKEETKSFSVVGN